MSRARGHARKKKARLTSHTWSTVMELDRRAVAEAPAAQPSALESVELDILDLLRAEPNAAAVPASYNDAGSVFMGADGFPADQFVLGLIRCPQCHNEMVYYQERALLAAGYRFRCRVCQHELLASLT
jgi:ribosomal protein S27E